MFRARLKGLTHVLQDVEDALSAEELTARQEKNLGQILTGCHNLLNEIGSWVANHSAVDSRQSTVAGKARRNWENLADAQQQRCLHHPRRCSARVSQAAGRP